MTAAEQAYLEELQADVIVLRNRLTRQNDYIKRLEERADLQRERIQQLEHPRRPGLPAATTPPPEAGGALCSFCHQKPVTTKKGHCSWSCAKKADWQRRKNQPKESAPMKHTLTAVCIAALMVLMLAGTVQAQETPPVPTCSQATPCTLQWTPNTEEDMAEYRIYVTRTQGAYDLDHPAAVVAHPTATRPATGLGTLAEGRHYVVLVAVDQAGNASGPSNEVEFIFDAPPGTPVLELIQVTIP